MVTTEVDDDATPPGSPYGLRRGETVCQIRLPSCLRQSEQQTSPRTPPSTNHPSSSTSTSVPAPATGTAGETRDLEARGRESSAHQHQNNRGKKKSSIRYHHSSPNQQLEARPLEQRPQQGSLSVSSELSGGAKMSSSRRITVFYRADGRCIHDDLDEESSRRSPEGGIPLNSITGDSLWPVIQVFMQFSREVQGGSVRRLVFRNPAEYAPPSHQFEPAPHLHLQHQLPQHLAEQQLRKEPQEQPEQQSQQQPQQQQTSTTTPNPSTPQPSSPPPQQQQQQNIQQQKKQQKPQSQQQQAGNDINGSEQGPRLPVVVHLANDDLFVVAISELLADSDSAARLDDWKHGARSGVALSDFCNSVLDFLRDEQDNFLKSPTGQCRLAGIGNEVLQQPKASNDRVADSIGGSGVPEHDAGGIQGQDNSATVATRKPVVDINETRLKEHITKIQNLLPL